MSRPTKGEGSLNGGRGITLYLVVVFPSEGEFSIFAGAKQNRDTRAAAMKTQANHPALVPPKT